MKYHNIMSAVLISTLMLPSAVATAKGGGAAAGARAVSISKSASAASRSASAASRSASAASRAAASSRNSSNDAALWASLGATNALLVMNSNSEDSKDPTDEIARRINIINLAKDSKDDVVLSEADIAKSELAGYQEFREEAAKERQSDATNQKFYDEQFDDKNPQDAIAKRMNIINMVGSSDDPVLAKEADIARNELLGYREYRDSLTDNQTSSRKNPKDEIMKRISIIMLAKDSKDDVVLNEADVARSELSGYQDYRATNGTKPIADSRYIQDEIEWRINIIKIAENVEDAVVKKEADIAKADLEAYRSYKEKVAAEREQEIATANAKTEEMLGQAGQFMVNFVKFGAFGLAMFILFSVLRRRKLKREKEINKYARKRR